MEQMETYEEIDRIFVEKGIDVSSFLEYRIAKDKSFLEMPVETKVKFDTSFDKLKSNFKTTKEKGDALENLVRYLTYSNENLFNLKTNIRTSSNEIDLFLTPSDKGKLLFNSYYKFIGEGILCECKNFNSHLDVTYVGKFFSLLCLSGYKIGIIFTLKGLSGPGKWESSKGLIRKIALKEEIYILDFTLEDYKNIKENGTVFLDIVENKYIALKNDIDYDDFLTKHEAEDEYKRINGIK